MNEFDLFVEAKEKDPSEVDAFLSEVCSEQPEMKQRIDALLKAHCGLGFLDTLEERAGPWQPPTIPGYKLLEQIGEGAFGNVYMAEEIIPVQRRVAVKVLKLGMDTKQVVARFDAERQAMAMMDHPSIASVFDAGATDRGRPYFAMELVRGESITEFCDRERMGTQERLQLVVDVCRAIQHAHQKGVIHRDIKPSNVMVTNHDGKALPKVIDFGIAKATDEPLTEKTLFTQFRQMVGTPAYMSPEQAELNASDVDTRSDIYSVGVLMYELLTGKTPLELKGSSYEDMLDTIRETEPPTLAARVNSLDAAERSTVAGKRRVAPDELARIVHGELNWIVSKALSKDRTRRYDTAAALADDVERYLNNQPVLASPPSATYKLGKFVRRNRVLVASIGAVLTALILGLVVAISGQRAAWTQAALAQAERQKAVDQAARANKTFDVLRDLLVVSHPETGYGPDYTMREALDEFVKTLPTRFDGSTPGVEADIKSIVGNTYSSLTFRYDAEEFLKQTVELRKAVSPVDHLKLAEAYRDQARNAMTCCDPWQAKTAAASAIEAFHEADNQPPDEVHDIQTRATRLIEVRQTIIDLGDRFQHHEALPLLRPILKQEPELLAGTTLIRAVFLLLDLGKYEEAVSVCKLTPSDFNVKYSDKARNVRAILNGTLSFIYEEHGATDLVEKLSQSLLLDADGNEVWFDNNEWQKMILARAILRSKDSTDEAKQRALQLSEEFAGMVKANASRIAPFILSMACDTYVLALIQHGRMEEAESTLQTGLSLVPQFSMFAKGVLEWRLAALYEGDDRTDESEGLLREAVCWRREHLPEDYVQISLAELHLAKLLHRIRPDSSSDEVRGLLDSAHQRVKALAPDNYYRESVETALEGLASE